MSDKQKLAVVLLNLGGPDSLDAVEPFLRNLFSDPAIITVPWPLRPLLARVIAKRRAPVAREIYAEMGGRSPLLPETKAQADALEHRLTQQADTGFEEVRVFISMRYWHPMGTECARQVKAFAPDRIVLLPLYPQYSTTTTGSSFADWDKAASGIGLSVPTSRLCCYPIDSNFTSAHAGKITERVDAWPEDIPLRLLFSAHGLPKKTVLAGDPYQMQVEQTVAEVLRCLDRQGLEGRVSYQSRVGPLEWIGPSTEAEIIQAGHDGVGLMVVPIAFVSEHSETKVELDIEYSALAREKGVPHYERVPTLSSDKSFIATLENLVTTALKSNQAVCSAAGGSACETGQRSCPMKGL